MLPDRLYDGTKTPLGDSLAVEHLALTRVALVRIQVPQPTNLRHCSHVRSRCFHLDMTQAGSSPRKPLIKR